MIPKAEAEDAKSTTVATAVNKNHLTPGGFALVFIPVRLLPWLEGWRVEFK